MTNLILIRVNCPNEAIATEIAEAAISARVAGCANINGPIRSIYSWQGEIEREQEWVLWLKVKETDWDKAEALVLSKHPFDTPALLGIPCSHANRRYADWLAEETKDKI
ncbi:MAG: divalent-cation tolerance protein CutA [Pseudomonadota bacterium]